MKRSIWFWLCFVLTVILAIYFATRIIMVGMGHGDISRVRNISISADGRNKDLSMIANAASVAPGTRTYSVNLDNINTRILSVPGVQKSAVRRLANGNLSVQVSLYTAIALWTDGANYYPLSADGTIVNTPTEIRDENHIVFRGAVPNDISAITDAAQNLLGILDYIEWIENRRWNLHTTGGITIKLPEHNAINAINTLITMNQTHHILNRKISVIDMRDDARILVK
ncbi:MAG: cell division protein FtsQ/DivIB [Alphaproteobacteria bacterium]|nr:cell division protein FtsQ/DivIB [Alphaproteobacteria bacterium]